MAKATPLKEALKALEAKDEMPKEEMEHVKLYGIIPPINKLDASLSTLKKVTRACLSCPSPVLSESAWSVLCSATCRTRQHDDRWLCHPVSAACLPACLPVLHACLSWLSCCPSTSAVVWLL